MPVDAIIDLFISNIKIVFIRSVIFFLSYLIGPYLSAYPN